jgi:hypothetical protein
MYKCDCGHWRCATVVSRRTWFRHKMQTILRNQLEEESAELTEPMPVEDAYQPAEEPDHAEDPVYPEVKSPMIFLCILRYTEVRK